MGLGKWDITIDTSCKKKQTNNNHSYIYTQQNSLYTLSQTKY